MGAGCALRPSQLRFCAEAAALFAVDVIRRIVRAKGRAEMWKLLSVFLLLLATPRLNAQSAVQSTEQERILALESSWNQAEQQKDAAALKILLGPELVYVDYDGTIMNKAEYLASVHSPSLHPERIVNESMTVQLYGAVAVVNGVYREKGVKSGKPYAFRGRFTDTWISARGSWVCVASQSTLIMH